MEVAFATRKLARRCASQKEMSREWGPENARRLAARLSELRAADNLADMRALPQARAHALSGDRKGEISLDLSHPHRLILTLGNPDEATHPDGGLDWTKVTAVVVQEVVDTH